MAVKGTLRPLKDKVIVTDMNFGEGRTRSGIVLTSDDGKSSGLHPRWCRVLFVGEDQKDIKVGQWLLMQHGRWTRGIDVEDETGKKTLRRIDPNDILMISDEEVHDETFSAAIHVDKKPDHMLHG